MKTKIVCLVSFLIVAFSVRAQQGINYKAIINDADGNVLVNTPVTVQFTILHDGSTEVYKESHVPTTDANGIIIVNIGEGAAIDGAFDAIDWGSAPHFLKTEIDKGEGLTDMGTTEFKTVPYALFALTARNIESSSSGQYYYSDKDGDGFGDSYNPVFVPLGATPPVGFIIEGTDCNDEDANVNQDAEEIEGDGIDNNCDGQIDQLPNDISTDDDGDGYSENEGDFNDYDYTVYPGANEICGDGIDQDCNGSDLNCPTFDMYSHDPIEAAHAIGLNNDVISASWQLPDGSAHNQSIQFFQGIGIMQNFGSNVTPIEGTQLLVLSTGMARLPSDPDYQDDLRKGYSVTLPAGFPQTTVGCPTSYDAFDGVSLSLEIQVPKYANGFQFNFRFYSSEYPDHECSEYNDQAVAIVTPNITGSINGNIVFDAYGNPISVNASYLNVCSGCSEGVNELQGSGFESHGATSWLQTSAPVEPGSTIEINFSIWDTGDDIMSSTLLVDNWVWLSNSLSAPHTVDK